MQPPTFSERLFRKGGARARDELVTHLQKAVIGVLYEYRDTPDDFKQIINAPEVRALFEETPFNRKFSEGFDRETLEKLEVVRDVDQTAEAGAKKAAGPWGTLKIITKIVKPEMSLPDREAIAKAMAPTTLGELSQIRRQDVAMAAQEKPYPLFFAAPGQGKSGITVIVNDATRGSSPLRTVQQ